MFWLRLFSSTITPGQIERSRTSWSSVSSRMLDEVDQRVEHLCRERDGLARVAAQQALLADVQGEVAEFVERARCGSWRMRASNQNKSQLFTERPKTLPRIALHSQVRKSWRTMRADWRASWTDARHALSADGCSSVSHSFVCAGQLPRPRADTPATSERRRPSVWRRILRGSISRAVRLLRSRAAWTRWQRPLLRRLPHGRQSSSG